MVSGSSRQYGTHVRSDLMDMVSRLRPRPRRILSIGVGVAETERALRERYRAFVVGVEVEEHMASIAKPKIDRVYVADAEGLDYTKLGGLFDLVICADVLEHLREPERVLSALSGAIDEHGILLISIPNVRYWYTFYQLLVKADWEYRDWGLFDRTHLRFFTFKSVCRIITASGYQIVNVRRKLLAGGSTPLRQALMSLLKFLVPRDLFTYQYLVVARKSRQEIVSPSGDNRRSLPFGSSDGNGLAGDAGARQSSLRQTRKRLEMLSDRSGGASGEGARSFVSYPRGEGSESEVSQEGD